MSGFLKFLVIPNKSYPQTLFNVQNNLNGHDINWFIDADRDLVLCSLISSRKSHVKSLTSNVLIKLMACLVGRAKFTGPPMMDRKTKLFAQMRNACFRVKLPTNIDLCSSEIEDATSSFFVPTHREVLDVGVTQHICDAQRAPTSKPSPNRRPHSAVLSVTLKVASSIHHEMHPCEMISATSTISLGCEAMKFRDYSTSLSKFR